MRLTRAHRATNQRSPMNRSWAFSLVLILMTVVPLPDGTAKAADTVFVVTKSDRQFVKYFNVVNGFEDAVVVYQFGEVTVAGNGSVRRIFLDAQIPSDGYVQNGPDVGVQEDLRKVLRTQPFFIENDEDSIRFYREASIRNYNVGLERFTDTWKLDDRTEYVARLVRASDGVVLQTIDSVMIDSTATPGTWATFEGTSPQLWCRSVFVLPTARACSVYVEIEPRRQGSSHYGMVASMKEADYSLGAFFSCGSANITPAQNGAIRRQRFSRIIDYFDAFYAQYCALPDWTYLSLIKPEADSIIRRYYEYQGMTPEGDTIHRVKACGQPKNASEAGRERLADRHRAIHIAAIRYDGGMLSIGIDSEREQQALISVVHATAVRSYAVGRYDLVDGRTDLSLHVDLTNGVYIVSIYQPDAGAWISGEFVVVR